jgi:hypothetical protein
MAARAHLPQFSLEGVWAGRYGEHGHELIQVEYDENDMLVARKLTGDENVPAGEMTFRVDLAPPLLDDVRAEAEAAAADRRHGFERDEIRVRAKRRAHARRIARRDAFRAAVEAGDEARAATVRGTRPEPIEIDEQAGKAVPPSLEVLERWYGEGQVACRGYAGAHFVPGQMVLIGDHFAFVWMTPGNAMGHQIFFTRPTAQMMREYVKSCSMRERLERELNWSFSSEDDDGNLLPESELDGEQECAVEDELYGRSDDYARDDDDDDEGGP